MKTVSEDECLALWLDEWTQFLKFKRWKDTRDAEEEGMEPSSPEEVENFRQAILNLPRPYDSKEPVPGDLRLLAHWSGMKPTLALLFWRLETTSFW